MIRPAVLFLAWASLALTGCFSSEEPLIGDSAERLPVEAGRYEVLGDSPGAGELSVDGLSYRFLFSGDPDGEVTTARFRQLAPGIYAGEECGESCIYGVLIFRDDGSAALYAPTCGELNAADRARLGLEESRWGDCDVADWTALKNALMAWLDVYDPEAFGTLFIPL